MPFSQDAKPYFTVIVPVTDQTAYMLPFTLDSIVEQAFDAFEIIIIDGQSKAHTHDVFQAYRNRITRIYSALDKNLFAMMNKGISLAKGEYVHILIPGEFYISKHAFTFVKQFIDSQADPDLLYTAYLSRHQYSPSQIILKQIEEEDLKGGKVPMSLQAYWFKNSSLRAIGAFNCRYRQQAGFDLICRFYRAPIMKKSFMRRVLTDFEYRLPPPRQIISHLVETLMIIFIHFGWSKAVIWWMAQNHLRFLRWWMKSIKAALWKGSEAHS
ncbi:MAG: glycosyltransferase [Verrucomicrobia bacterium]|nr:glycosyltransferase [Verrucomicrobiota bacterium]